MTVHHGIHAYTTEYKVNVRVKKNIRNVIWD